MIRKEKHTVYFQGCSFWGDAQVLGYGRLNKRVQGRDMMNEKQSLPCWRWCRGLLSFLRWFLWFALLFLFRNIGKLVIPHDHLFLILNILYLILFKSLHRKGELSISGKSDLPFVWNIFVAIYFRPRVSKFCPSRAATMHQILCHYQWQVETLRW